MHIVRMEKHEKKEETSTSDETSVSLPIADKQDNKSRRIFKRQKAKQRNSVKSLVLTPSVSVAETPKKHIPEDFDQATSDNKCKRKMVQMIRNRISAQNSRDRKKAYMKKLEMHQKKLASENFQYQKELVQYKQMNEALKLECEYLRRCLMTNISETHDTIYKNEDDIIQNESNEMCQESKSEVCTKKQNSSTHLKKYSLALATLFAVLMFSNITLQNGNSALQLSQLGQQLNTLESQIQQGTIT